MRDTIAKLKETNQPLLKALATSLPERKQQFLKEVVQSQRVPVGAGTTQQTQARRTVKTVSRKIASVNKNN